MNALGGTPIYILSLAVQICSFLLLVRLLLQLVQADFYNPISQTIFKLTAPVVNPMNKVLPTVGTLNLASSGSRDLGQVVVLFDYGPGHRACRDLGHY